MANECKTLTMGSDATGDNAEYFPEEMKGSVVSYPQRCALWGDGGFHGNCDGRLFLSLVLRYDPATVADPMMGSGTTRDVIEGLNRHRRLSIKYWGGDLRKGFDLLTQDLPGSFDFIWIHPPYWSIVKYSEHPNDLCNAYEYPDFLRKLQICLRRCFDALKAGGRLAVLVGDVRRFGIYTPIARDVLAMEPYLGQIRSVIIKAQHKCRSDNKRYSQMEDVRIQHEYCIVFRRDGPVLRNLREQIHRPGGNGVK